MSKQRVAIQRIQPQFHVLNGWRIRQLDSLLYSIGRPERDCVGSGILKLVVKGGIYRYLQRHRFPADLLVMHMLATCGAASGAIGGNGEAPAIGLRVLSFAKTRYIDKELAYLISLGGDSELYLFVLNGKYVMSHASIHIPVDNGPPEPVDAGH